MPFLRRFPTPPGGGVTSSLLAFKIKAKDLGEGLKSDQIKIEIKLYSFAPEFPLELASWNSINQISENGSASEFFKVGDEKTVLINNVSYTFVILGFNHDDKSDGSGKAGITFGMKKLLTGTYQMNSSRTNVGGWESCYMRNTYMKTFFNQLSRDLQSVIKTVDKKNAKGTSPSQDKLFLFSRVEIDGTGTSPFSAEGSRYQYYANNGINARKKGSAWWLRSPRESYDDHFRYFNGDGNIDYGNADYARGVCFGFCV